MLKRAPPIGSVMARLTRVAVPVLVLLTASPSIAADDSILFRDDFESGLGHWELVGDGAFSLRDAEDPQRGSVLVLSPHGDAYALIKGSERWHGVAIEGWFQFPSEAESYLGVVYNFERRARRTDFGLIYVKSPNNYLQVNTHRDFNVGRTLYPEYRVPLAAQARFETGRWQRFRVERIGDTCHFYVDDSTQPQLTFAGLDLAEGPVGLQPRSVGGEVHVDDIVVSALDEFSYSGPPIPDVDYAPGNLLTNWQVYGPLPATDDAAAAVPSSVSDRWHAFASDRRGAVLTGSVVDYHGSRTVAYFRTTVDAPEAGRAILHLSTVDDLALWVNGRFHWFIPRMDLAWHDFTRNPHHAGRRIPITLRAGTNEIVLRVRGGVYASGGFYAAVEDASG